MRPRSGRSGARASPTRLSLDRFKNDFNADFNFNFNVAFNFNDFNGTNDCLLAKIGLDTSEHDAPKSLTFHFRNFSLSNPI